MYIFFLKEVADVSAITKQKFESMGMVRFNWLAYINVPGIKQIKKYIPRYVGIQALVKFKRKFSKRVVTKIGWLFVDS